MRYYLFTILFSLLTGGLHAQSITGRVQDSNTLEALPFANVFLNNTTIGTVTDNNGEFRLSGIKEPGAYEIVFSFVGYETYKIKVLVDGGAQSMGTIKMIPSEIELSSVEVTGTRDSEWEKNLKKFKKVFLGEGKQAAACTILNPWVIDFPLENMRNNFMAKASAPIEMENRWLGYKVVFYLIGFWYGANEYAITGNALFSELKSTSAREEASWQANRRKAYQHSTNHLFKSIIEHRIRGEGFTLYTDAENYKNATTRSSQFNAELDKSVVKFDTSALVVADQQKGFYKITMKGRVEVHDSKVKSLVRVYQDVFGSVSWITLKNNFVIVNKSGFPRNATDVIVSGDMSTSRVASMLPLDYTPAKTTSTPEKIDFSSHREQVYIHTDKPYYYPGEAIWFKGYMNYATPALRDSLSRTIYVELIDRSEEAIVMAKTLEIGNGFFDNDFALPENLPAKMYYLRAYTNFNRNFGPESFYVRPIPVLSLNEKLLAGKSKSAKAIAQYDLFSITADKEVYKPREKITLTLKLKDDDENPVAANISLAVVDSAQVVVLEDSNTILNGYPIVSEGNQVVRDMSFPVENGISFSGKFMNDSGKPENAALMVFQMNPQGFTIAQSDDKGIFEASGLAFYDTAMVSVQATNSKGQAYGKAELIRKKTVAIDFKESKLPGEVIKTELPQRVMSGYEVPREARLLQEVVIESTKPEENNQVNYRVKRSYGKPDYVIDKKDINASYGNLLQTLPGKVPGLIVREMTDGVGTRRVVYIERSGMNSSIQFPKEVLVTINDVFINGTPEEVLSSIDPASVESVEVSTSVNVLYGSVGGNGIVSVYTKKEFEEEVKSGRNLTVIKVPGYSRPHIFNSPDYDNPATDAIKSDYRSTIYWNPEVILNASEGTATVSFFAADLPGKYRIVAEGINEKGNPIRCVYLVRIDN